MESRIESLRAEAVAAIEAASDPKSLDELITQASQNWRLERMSRIDRNILRLGTWELRHKEDVPVAVIIDEAVELAKRYGNENSSSFINGVLNRVAQDHAKPRVS